MFAKTLSYDEFFHTFVKNQFETVYFRFRGRIQEYPFSVCESSVGRGRHSTSATIIITARFRPPQRASGVLGVRDLGACIHNHSRPGSILYTSARFRPPHYTTAVYKGRGENRYIAVGQIIFFKVKITFPPHPLKSP